MGDTHSETLTPDQLIHFNRMLTALISRLKIEGLHQELLDLGPFDGTNQVPFPFPDLHWELATCWMLVDGTLPLPITLNDGSTIDYTSILLRDPSSIQRWRKKLDYAKTGFHYR